MRHSTIAYYASGDTLRSRCLGGIVRTGVIDIPAPLPRALADWQREASAQLALEAGDVDVMPLARTQARWPEYKRCVEAMAGWMDALGVLGVLADSDMSLMACRGARYHHDADQYGDMAFCNLFLSDDRGLDVHFPATGQRIPLTRGTALLFDTGQPHGVIRRGSSGFRVDDFPTDRDCLQVFLTWELPVEHAKVARALDVVFDIDAPGSQRLDRAQVRVDGAAAEVCPASGRWRAVG
jgi:hypothetical protein